MLQNTQPPFPLPRASLNWSTNHVFSFWRDQNLDVIPKLFPTSFLKTSRQAHNPVATCPQTSSDAGSTFFPAHNFAAQAWLQPTHCGMGLLLYVGAGAFLQLPYRCTSSNLNQHKQHAQFSHNNTTMPNSQSRLGCQDAWMHAGYQYQALGANNFSLTQRHLHTPSRNAHKEYNSGSCMEDARSFMRLIRSAKLILLGFALISGLGG